MKVFWILEIFGQNYEDFRARVSNKRSPKSKKGECFGLSECVYSRFWTKISKTVDNWFYDLWSFHLSEIPWLMIFNCFSRNNASSQLSRSWALSMLNWCTVSSRPQSKHKVEHSAAWFEKLLYSWSWKCWLLVAKLVVGSWDLSTAVNQAVN